MNVLDLFSGIGGFSLGLERAGMSTIAFCETDKNCQTILRKNFGHITPIFDDIKKLYYKDNSLKYKGDPNSYFTNIPIDLLCGGFPCQGISVAGKKRGLKDDRSGLWKEFYRIIKEIQPRYVIIENVANLRNLGLATIIKDLWKIGYVGKWHIISVRSICSGPHLRERIWIIAYGADSNLPRLWKPFASEKEKSEWWSKTTSCFSNWWKTKSRIHRMANGLSKELDKERSERVRQLGNSVNPYIPEMLGKMIIEHEQLNKEG